MKIFRSISLTHIICATVLLMASRSAIAADPDWLHIYHVPQEGVRSITSMPVSDSPTVTHPAPTAAEEAGVISLSGSGDGTMTVIPLAKVERVELATNVPLLAITTDDPTFTEIIDKKTYLEGTLTVTAYGDEAPLSMAPLRVKVRGRGNSTMLYEKKPYRLNFSNNPEKPLRKPSLLGMTPAKNYVLIANVQDPTLMWNTTAFYLAKRAGQEFVNSSVPVRVSFNGIDKGAYMLSEKIGINAASVDIDETEGRLLELSTDYDEDFRWLSPRYALPVMVKDPDLAEIAAEATTTTDALVADLKTRFAALEEAVAAGHPENELDMDALASYMLVQLLSGNKEVNHPKSIYLYSRGKDDKWHFGPVWDYDWAFDFAFGADSPLLDLRYSDAAQTQVKCGNEFFRTIVDSESFRTAFEAAWQRFKADTYPGLMEWIDGYAARIRPSALENGDIWRGRMTDYDHYVGEPRDSGTFDAAITEFKQWLADRVAYIDHHPRRGFYD